MKKGYWVQFTTSVFVESDSEEDAHFAAYAEIKQDPPKYGDYIILTTAIQDLKQDETTNIIC